MGNIFSQNPMWAITIATTLFGIIAAGRLSDWRNSRNAIRPTIIKFKSSFEDQIANSNRIGQFYLGDMASGFSKHESAVKAIMPILPERYKRKLQKAWNEYSGKDNGFGYSPEKYVQTMFACIELSTKPEYSENIDGKLHNLYTCLDDLR